MRTMIIQMLAFILSLAVLACSTVSTSQPAVDVKTAQLPSAGKGVEKAVFAGGCFWGVEAVFEHVKGVTDVRSGYAGGSAKDADYEKVSNGNTGHAESVQVIFDPEKVSYAQLLQIFFSVVHDPTQLNYQGPDHGTQYRSAIFYTSEVQKKMASDYIASLTAARTFSKPIVTEMSPLKQFFEAEKYHQDYLKHHPDEPYIVVNDQPKVAALKEKFPDLWRD